MEEVPEGRWQNKITMLIILHNFIGANWGGNLLVCQRIGGVRDYLKLEQNIRISDAFPGLVTYLLSTTKLVDGELPAEVSPIDLYRGLLNRFTV